jgi:NTE family protein
VRVGLALGSGGARGIAHIAYLEVLDQLLVKTSAVSGSSIGALLGALYAGGMSGSRLREIATGLTIRDIPRLLDAPSLNESIGIKGRKIEEWLRGLLPVKTFEDLPIPLRIVATDYWKGEQVAFSTAASSSTAAWSIPSPSTCSSASRTSSWPSTWRGSPSRARCGRPVRSKPSWAPTPSWAR